MVKENYSPVDNAVIERILKQKPSPLELYKIVYSLSNDPQSIIDQMQRQTELLIGMERRFFTSFEDLFTQIQEYQKLMVELHELSVAANKKALDLGMDPVPVVSMIRGVDWQKPLYEIGLELIKEYSFAWSALGINAGS